MDTDIRITATSPSRFVQPSPYPRAGLTSAVHHRTVLLGAAAAAALLGVAQAASRDFVVLRADPLADIRNIAEVEAVLRRGQIVTRASSRNQGAQP